MAPHRGPVEGASCQCMQRLWLCQLRPSFLRFVFGFVSTHKRIRLLLRVLYCCGKFLAIAWRATYRCAGSSNTHTAEIQSSRAVGFARWSEAAMLVGEAS